MGVGSRPSIKKAIDMMEAKNRYQSIIAATKVRPMITPGGRTRRHAVAE